jgi:multiple sugar transport system ATP-binding protein
MSSVELRNVQKTYPNGYEAVRNTSLRVQSGEFVILVGPSGCGKSTLLRMIAGLEEVTSGEILIGDRVVNDLSPRERNIAMVFQNYALYPHMTVRQNMGFALKQAKLPRPEIAERVSAAAEILGLEDMLERKPKQMSGGQRQRVAVGRAIVRDADVFLFDEPLSNLDASLRGQMRTEISKLHQRLGKTMIYVTHDQVEAMTMADRIVVVKGGDVLQYDSPLEIYNKPANEFVAGFIGSPPMNIIDGSTESGVGRGLQFVGDSSVVFDLPDAVVTRFNLSAGQSIKIGLRPEDIYLEMSGTMESGMAKADLCVDVLEPMGNETIVHAKLAGPDGAPIVCRGRLQSLPTVGDTVTSHVDLARASIFDRETGRSLDTAQSAFVG